MSIKQVHIVFKTHLDVGFTDSAQGVVARYFDEYFPRAIATAARLRALGRAERFIWTTGSWLLYEYLEQASKRDRKRMESAIAHGDIAWHGLPFTTHSELMDADLFRYGLSLSQELDRRFGKHTIAAKMTDVPGHTRSIVPLLAEAGIRFLHIGVNDAVAMPEVPPLFLWRDPSGAEIIVMYHHSYGGFMAHEASEAALAMEMTLDNVGPHSLSDVVSTHMRLRGIYPDAQVHSSTLHDFAAQLFPFADTLPVITQEIGDTWIHGIGSDPQKVRRFRELCRLRTHWLMSGRATLQDADFAAFSRKLLLVAEHTWGFDTIMHLADTTSYAPPVLRKTRAAGHFAPFEASWQEQRAYLDAAIAMFENNDFAAEARIVERNNTILPEFSIADDVEGSAAPTIETPYFQCRIDPQHGGITHLVAKESGYQWADATHPLGVVRYAALDAMTYAAYLLNYVTPQFREEWWPQYAFGKPGVETMAHEAGEWEMHVVQMVTKTDGTGHTCCVTLNPPAIPDVQGGCPPSISVLYHFPNTAPHLHMTVLWAAKPAGRLPEALWCSFTPRVADRGQWQLLKMGLPIDPGEVVSGGNQSLHAVNDEVRYRDAERAFTLVTPDAPLVAPGQRRLLWFTRDPPDMRGGVHVNLCNNVWNTNFPLWTEGAAQFRFTLRFDSRRD